MFVILSGGVITTYIIGYYIRHKAIQRYINKCCIDTHNTPKFKKMGVLSKGALP